MKVPLGPVNCIDCSISSRIYVCFLTAPSKTSGWGHDKHDEATTTATTSVGTHRSPCMRRPDVEHASLPWISSTVAPEDTGGWPCDGDDDDSPIRRTTSCMHAWCLAVSERTYLSTDKHAWCLRLECLPPIGQYKPYRFSICDITDMTPKICSTGGLSPKCCSDSQVYPFHEDDESWSCHSTYSSNPNREDEEKGEAVGGWLVIYACMQNHHPLKFKPPLKDSVLPCGKDFWVVAGHEAFDQPSPEKGPDFYCLVSND